jgi:hypothetical protein
MRRFLPLLFLSALSTAAFAQQRGASITAVAPTFGPPGTTVSIRGAGFNGFERGSPWVKELTSEPPPGMIEFNGVPGDVLFWQDDLITVRVPKHASTGVLRIVLPQARIVLTADVFDVYYSTGDETAAQKSEFAQAEGARAAQADRSDEAGERSLFFDEPAPQIPLYVNPWFSSLSPGERTFFAENGFGDSLFFGNPFSLGRKGSFFLNNGLFPQRGIRGRSGFGRFRSDDVLFPDFFIRGSRKFGVRPFWFSFDRNRPSSFSNEGHIFRR